VKNRQYGDTADDIVRDRLVVTVSDMGLRRRYYECTRLTMTEAIDKLLASEVTSIYLSELSVSSRDEEAIF
jgi:cobalamin-dependent methionine synthase I